MSQQTQKLLVGCGALTLFFLAQCFWGYCDLVIYPLVLFLVLIDTLPNGVSYLLFCIPFCALRVPYSLVLYGLCVVAYLIKFYVCQFRLARRTFNWRFWGLLGLLVLYCLLPIGGYNLNRLAKIALLLAVIVVLDVAASAPENLRLQFNLRLLGVALILSCVFSLTYKFSPYLQANLPRYWAGGNAPRFTGLFLQPNMLALVCELLCGVWGYYIMTRRAQWPEYVLLLVTTVLGLLTFSKTFLLLGGLVYFVLFIYFLRRDWTLTIMVVTVAGGLVVGLCMISHSFAETYVKRFFNTLSTKRDWTMIVDVLTTGRAHLWVTYLKYLWQHPWRLIFGRGLGAPILPNVPYSAHNFYITILYQIGLVGAALFIALVAMLICKLVRSRSGRVSAAIFLPLVVLELLLCVEDFILYIF